MATKRSFLTHMFASIIACCFFCITYASRQEDTGRSFFFTRPLFNTCALQEAGWHAIIAQRQTGTYGSFQLATAYKQSRERDKTNRYFAPLPCDRLYIAGDAVVPPLTEERTIRAEWLQLNSDFSAHFKCVPHQQQCGIFFDYNQGFARWTDRPFFRNAYFSIHLPLVQVKNDLELISCDMNTTSTATLRTVQQAFTNPTWRYGKAVDNRSCCALAEIRLQLGQFFLAEEYNQLGYYLGLSIPTSAKQDPAYWFDPVAGLNGNPAINFGITMQFQINRSNNPAICFFLLLDDLWQIRSHQCRTFDLCNKPWSRFMLFNTNQAAPHQKTNIPGVNILTQEALVRPYSLADFTMGWRFKTAHTETEFGYNLWGHGDEDIQLRYPDDVPSGWGIAGSQPGTSASQSTIATQAPNDPTFIAFEACDLDLTSAAAGSALNHSVHAALSYIHYGHRVHVFFNTGCMLSYPQKNGALQTWSTWVKIGSSF